MLRWDGLTEKVRSSNAFPEPSGETSALFSTVRPRLRGGGYKHPRCSSCSLERVLAQGAPLWSPNRPSEPMERCKVTEYHGYILDSRGRVA